MEDRRYIPALTGFRVIPALMVCIFHFNPFSQQRVGNYVHGFFNEFHVGVTFFFVLSGFLVTYRYYTKDKVDFGKYLVNRFARIYPIYFIITTLLFACSFITSSTTQSPGYFLFDYFLNISFLKGFFDQYKFSGILQGWSLTVEEMFYLIAPFAFLLIKRKKFFIVALPLFFLLLGLLLVALFHNVDFFGFFQNLEFVISYTFFGRAAEFFVGLSIAILYIGYERNKTLIVSKKYPYTLSGIIISILLIFCISLFKGDQPFGIRHPYAKVINNLLLPAVGIACLFWGLLTESTILRRILSTPIMVRLGKSSYAFYLIHIWVSEINSNFVFVLLVAGILSVIINIFIEEPLNSYVKSLFARRNKILNISND